MRPESEIELAEIRQDIAELRCDIAGLLEAWNTANGVVKFVKWIAAIAGALTTIYVACAVSKDIVIHNVTESFK